MSRKFSDFARTQAELAGVLGIGVRTVRDWSAAGMNCFREGMGYSVPLAIEWAKANRWAGKAGQSPEDDDRRSVAELRKLEADAQIREVKARQLMGTLVDRDAVDAAIDTLLNAIRNRLQAVPEEVCTVVPGAHRESVASGFRNRLRLILAEINAWQSDRHCAGQRAQGEKEVTDTTSEEGAESGVTDLLEGAGK